MAGVLQFTLGLEAQQFLRNIGLATGGIFSLMGAGKLLSTVMENVGAAISRGGNLVDLSNRTGESVRNLYQLEEAFKSVGVGSDNVAPMLGRLQKALSGVDESGQKTDKLFNAIGLDLDQLKSMDAAKQMEMLAAALSQVDKNSAAGLASKLFGREGAGQFLQITRDINAFKQSFRDSAAAADVFAASAAAFDTIGDTVTTIKMKLGGFWAGVASGAAPAIQAAADFINKLDFVSPGRNFGTFISGVTQAFRDGRLSELIADAFKMGFDSVIGFLPGVFEKLGYLLIKAFETPLVWIQSAMEYALTSATNAFANNPWFRSIVNVLNPAAGAVLASMGDAGGESFQDILARNQEEGVRFDIGLGEFGTADVNADADARISAAKDAFKEKWAQFWGDIEELSKKGTLTSAPSTSGPGVDIELPTGKREKASVSALEKIGLVIGNSRSNDDARETARNTARTNDILSKLPKAIAAALPQQANLVNA